MLKGIPASPGIAIGKAYILDKENFCILEYRIKKEEVDKEVRRFKRAVEESKRQILKIKEKVREKIGEKEANIFQSYLSILEDPLLIEETIKKIKEERLNAETALREVCKSFLERFKVVQTEFIEERFRDIEDIAERILHNLLKRPIMSLSHLEENIIVIAHNLAPSDTASMDKDKVLGFATDVGGRTSHAAIMARALEIPAVVGLRNVTKRVRPGTTVIVDGDRGRVIVDPTPSQIRSYQKRKKVFLAYKEKLESLKLLPAQTVDGREIELAANIAGPEEVDLAVENGAEGVGLYTVAEKVYPHSVIIRTLDIGGDKFLSPLPVPREINPFMGWRGIRLSLELVDVFKTQIRAILRAAQYGKVKIMFPLVSSLEEVREANHILLEVKNQLEKEGISFSNSVEVGIMIEVPSAAIIADVLAKEVDFFSLGTNDLIQYTLAVDRVNEKVAHLYQPLHPTILRLIDSVVKAAHRENIWVGACGEMANDPLGMPVLLGLGVDELSVAPTSILEVKKVIRSISWEETQRIASHLLGLSTSQQTRRYLEGKIGRKIRKILKGENNGAR